MEYQKLFLNILMMNIKNQICLHGVLPRNVVLEERAQNYTKTDKFCSFQQHFLQENCLTLQHCGVVNAF